MNKLTFSLLVGLAAAVFISSLQNFSGDYDNLRHGMIRLHILANSDSEEDQEVKLKVRDAVLEGSAGWLEHCKTLEDTKSAVEDKLPEIKAIAERALIENGFDEKVKCELTHMDFDTREYDSFTVPAGDYDALRITIGEAAGHNWWCVLYPPLCLPAASERADAEDYFTPEELDILKNPDEYEIRFKCIEWYRALIKKWEEFLA